jgi:hypothetical protein
LRLSQQIELVGVLGLIQSESTALAALLRSALLVQVAQGKTSVCKSDAKVAELVEEFLAFPFLQLDSPPISADVHHRLEGDQLPRALNTFQVIGSWLVRASFFPGFERGELGNDDKAEYSGEHGFHG